MKGYLKIEYNGRLPMIVYTEIGWEIERDTYSDELLKKLRSLIPGGDYSFVNKLKQTAGTVPMVILAGKKQWRLFARFPIKPGCIHRLKTGLLGLLLYLRKNCMKHGLRSGPIENSRAKLFNNRVAYLRQPGCFLFYGFLT